MCVSPGVHGNSSFVTVKRLSFQRVSQEHVLGKTVFVISHLWSQVSGKPNSPEPNSQTSSWGGGCPCPKQRCPWGQGLRVPFYPLNPRCMRRAVPGTQLFPRGWMYDWCEWKLKTFKTISRLERNGHGVSPNSTKLWFKLNINDVNSSRSPLGKQLARNTLNEIFLEREGNVKFTEDGKEEVDVFNA